MLLTELKRAVVLRPAEPGARLALAEALFQERDFRGAAEHARRALDLGGGEAARRLLCGAWARDGRQVEARKLLEECVRQSPQDASPRAELVALLEEHRPDDALLHALELTVATPGDLEAWRAVARLCERTNRPAVALPALRRARALAPEDPRLAESVLGARAALGLPATTAMLDAPPVEQAAQALALPTARAALTQAGLMAVAEALGRGALPDAKRQLVVASAAARASAAAALLRAELLGLEGRPSAQVEAAWRAALGMPGAPGAAALRLGDHLLEAARSAGPALDEAQALYARAAANGEGPVAAGREAELAERRRVLARDLSAVGRVGVLGWHPQGGHVSPLEAVAVPGRGVLRCSGRVGPEGQEAADVAFSVLRARAPALGLGELVARYDLHLHYTDTEVGKDGLSSGLALSLAGLSAYSQRPLPARLAATGEVTLSGEVRPVGGVHEKLVAAYLEGIRCVLYPRRNLQDVAALPPEVSGRLRLIAVDTLDEAWRAVRAAADAPGETRR
ncbi:ATP-dependent protease [Corallococcus sp. CA053C]|uniref:S16 family serine protease n=1 Tax=Corallococcus sp. CA053C TaxID=2316732 RepID=UPI000EA1FEC4|nr:S16 family serine protease [Corallococcus sp. CA053C]RKG98868.1 ATP-dependent protease [Corallococcus sp. CA053C]